MKSPIDYHKINSQCEAVRRSLLEASRNGRYDPIEMTEEDENRTTQNIVDLSNTCSNILKSMQTMRDARNILFGRQTLAGLAVAGPATALANGRPLPFVAYCPYGSRLRRAAANRRPTGEPAFLRHPCRLPRRPLLHQGSRRHPSAGDRARVLLRHRVAHSRSLDRSELFTQPLRTNGPRLALRSQPQPAPARRNTAHSPPREGLLSPLPPRPRQR